MNIIAGERRGTALFAPKGMDTRPTQAKVKESLFNIIQAYVPDSDVLDLFGGSGSLAMEALSRGARSACLCDTDREAVSCIKRNAEKLRYTEQITLLQRDWKQGLAQFAAEGRRFDLVFLDPPYRMEITGEIAAMMGQMGLLYEDAMLVLEHKTGLVPEPGEAFTLFRDRTYGETEIHFYLYQPDRKEDEA